MAGMDWFEWTPVTTFLVIKLGVLAVIAAVIGWRRGWYGDHPNKAPASSLRPRPGYSEAERLDT
jgi:hypothetical protein